ncbi:MAG: SufD family Fe-S cluster assembly protein [Bacteroidales bacterium]
MEGNLSAIHDRKPVIGHGKYVDIPVVKDAKTLVVRSGEKMSRIVVLDGPSMPFDRIIVEENASAELCLVVRPGVSADLPVTVDMVGEGSSVYLSGIYICGGDERVSLRTDIIHRAAHCSSDQLFNGIVSGRAGVEFFGKIIVAPEAQKIEAYQVNHNIMLSDDARIDAKPQLEIYADDVKCSHGATIGRLDESSQFYMRSRGIPLDEARVLQMISFISPVLSRVRNPLERESLAARLEADIRSLL